MIVIITGASHTGKTRLAQMLMEKHHFPYISEDHIKMGLIRSGHTDLTPADDDKMTDFLWPIMREMIKTAIENKQNLMVEGCYVPFDWKKEFSEEYLEQIKYICLCFSDAYIDSHFDEIKKYACCIENRFDDAYCTIEYVKKENHYYLNGCKENNLQAILIDDNYIENVNVVCDF